MAFPCRRIALPDVLRAVLFACKAGQLGTEFVNFHAKAFVFQYLHGFFLLYLRQYHIIKAAAPCAGSGRAAAAPCAGSGRAAAALYVFLVIRQVLRNRVASNTQNLLVNRSCSIMWYYLKFRIPTLSSKVKKKDEPNGSSFGGCRKTNVFRQPLDRNHAFDRISKKNRALQAHFFFPCINSEIRALGIYEFAPQILFYACCRTKHKRRNAAF